jgi:hypothetical protein
VSSLPAIARDLRYGGGYPPSVIMTQFHKWDSVFIFKPDQHTKYHA